MPVSYPDPFPCIPAAVSLYEDQKPSEHTPKPWKVVAVLYAEFHR